MEKANGNNTKPSLSGASLATSKNGNLQNHSQTQTGLVPMNKVAVPRKFPGGIKVNTVKRIAPPPRASPIPSSSSSSVSSGNRINGLSEEKRQRVEEIRRERERKKQEEEERLRPPKVVSAKVRDSSNIKRKKAIKHESDDDDEDDLFSTGSETSKKKRKEGKRSLNPQASSIGQGYKKLGRFGVLPYYLVPRKIVDEDAFATAPSTQTGRARQSASLVQMKQYGQFFSNLLEEQPKVALEYPAIGCCEDFSLLVPKDRDEYDPISDLLRTVRCIVEFYLTPEQQELFGSLESLETGSAAGHLLSSQSKGATPVPPSRETSTFESEGTLVTTLSPASPQPNHNISTSTREGTPILPLLSSLHSPVAMHPSLPQSPARSALLATANATAASSPLYPLDSPTTTSNLDPDSILRSFTKARNRRDGLLFIRTVHRFNTTLLSLKETGKIEENVKKMGEKGVGEGIWRCLQEQCYARTVAPRVEELSKYEAFSDNVYGELLPRFMSEICQLTNLGPNSVFVDLGSGVGNLLIQVALQTGSEAYGCEQMKVPSELASLQVQEAKERWKMWGIGGGNLQAWQGDFGEDERVREVLRRADVVLVNNYAFTAPTNDKLSLQFLDLKDGAQIVSLKPFVPSDFRLTERTLSSPLAILRVAQRYYTSGCVSWADGGGKYYIHTVDRSMIATFLEAREASTVGNGDVRKKQWKAAPQQGSDGEEGG